jgi:hypothetical protein
MLSSASSAASSASSSAAAMSPPTLSTKVFIAANLHFFFKWSVVMNQEKSDIQTTVVNYL